MNLAAKRLFRHGAAYQMENLDEAISHLTKSILLQPYSWLPLGSMILQALHLLADTLLMRSKLSNQPEDAIYATKYLFHLRDQSQDNSDVLRHRFAISLVEALAVQVKLEAGDVKENIRQMAILCHEHLISGLDTSDIDTTGLIRVVSGIVLLKIHQWIPDQPLDEVIKCLQAARKHRPDLLEGRVALAQSFLVRYCITSANDDYEEAMSTLDEIIISSSSPRDGQDKYLAINHRVATTLATGLAKLRSLAHRTPEYLEEAIYRNHVALSSTSGKDITSIFDIEDTARLRFDYFGSSEGVEASSDVSSSSQQVPPMTLDHELEVSGTFDQMHSLLFEIRNSDDMTKIDQAMAKARAILASHSPSDLFKGVYFAVFGGILEEAFERTHEIEYLNESISIRRQVTKDPYLPLTRYLSLPTLSHSLLLRFRYFPGHHTQDLNEALEILSQCISEARGSLPTRLTCACQWAYHARAFQHPSITTAYKTAMSLMQDTIHFSPTLQLQHATLATRDHTHSMPVDYASHQVALGQLKEAIETLERGRALLWSEMRHFHTSIDQLLETDLDLGHKFAAVNRELDELTKSVPPSHRLNVDDGPADDVRAVDKFGHLVLKRSRLLKERDKLVSQIQLLPGFGDFMTSPSFDTLRSAASSGPVILINHSEWRSDILILLHNASPSLIPTCDDFYDHASSLKNKLLDSRRKYGLDSKNYDEVLASVLAELHTLVGKPVIDRLRQLQVPEQSRIWWCPTSVFCSLPLHAMGPIPSNDGEIRYFLDLYICSYTPTLSAPIQSRNRDSDSRSSDQPSILLVAQPDPSLPTVGGEIQVVQALDTEVTSLISETATPTTVIEGFHHHRFVHFACHGTLEANNPFEAGFELDGGERLTILEIVRSHLSTAEFAFLSACHTAEVTEGSIVDEGLHLAAAVQYSGFRSVVGTMWAMVDEDGRDLAANFYKALFSPLRQDQAIPHHERSAKALRFAVKKLRRKKRITLERWVNFLHYGA